jgi:predicted HTH transcriptional regulator
MTRTRKKTSGLKIKLQKPIKKAVKPIAKKEVTIKPQSPTTNTKQLLTGPEGIGVDFKRSVDAVKQEDLVAFANGGGGIILVGVDEVLAQNGAQRGNIVGCDISDNERNKIVTRANQCRPAIAIQVKTETHGKLSIFRVEIPKGGLHCTSSGVYKIRRDGVTDIIDPMAMAQIIVERERKKILYYLRQAIQPDLENTRGDMGELYEELRSELEDMRSELDDPDEMDDYYEKDVDPRNHDEW